MSYMHDFQVKYLPRIEKCNFIPQWAKDNSHKWGIASFQLNYLIDWNETNKSREMTAVEKYHEGYRKAVYDIKEMFYCSNYEKTEE